MFDPFAQSESIAGVPLTVTRPPVVWIAASAASAVAGVLLAWLTGMVAFAFVGWILAGPVALCLLAVFIHLDGRARTSGVYGVRSWVRPVYWAGVVLALATVLATALRIADWAGRL